MRLPWRPDLSPAGAYPPRLHPYFRTCTYAQEW